MSESKSSKVSHKTHPRLYNVWNTMRQRCVNPNVVSYSTYGARGIRVCDRWMKSFQAFFDDMGDRPSPEYEIDRINNDGPYSPSNCRWATKTQQMRNRPDNVMITFRGEKRLLRDVIDYLRSMPGCTIHPLAIRSRLMRGVPEHLLVAPKEQQPRYILTRDDVKEIRRRAAKGDNQRVIAEDFGVKRVTVTAIHNKRIWKHV